MSEEACAKALECALKLVDYDDQSKKERRYRALIANPVWIDQIGNRLADSKDRGERLMYDDFITTAEVKGMPDQKVIGEIHHYLSLAPTGVVS